MNKKELIESEKLYLEFFENHNIPFVVVPAMNVKDHLMLKQDAIDRCKLLLEKAEADNNVIRFDA